MNPADDLLHTPPAGRPEWSETMYFHVWSVEHGVGIFAHTGRWPEDPELWWAQTIALLPDGALLVDRSWGRPVDSQGPATGNLQISCVEPGQSWLLRSDGAGERTDLATMTGAPVGAGYAQPFSYSRFFSATESARDPPQTCWSQPSA